MKVLQRISLKNTNFLSQTDGNIYILNIDPDPLGIKFSLHRLKQLKSQHNHQSIVITIPVKTQLWKCCVDVLTGQIYILKLSQNLFHHYI